MRRILIGTAAIGLGVFGAGAASAVDWASTSPNWSGFYVGGQLGYAWQPGDTDEQVVFDRNLDGNFGDAFPNFAPGNCGGRAGGRTPASGCGKDNDGTSWRVQAGWDYQFGETSGPVVGVVVDYGQAKLRDSVSTFSTTPAFYTITARVKNQGSARARAGYSLPSGTLVYGTGGLAYGKIRNSFATSNAVNTFTESNAKKDAWGYVYGGGIEQKVGPFSIGAVYLMNVLNNKDYRVTASGGAVGGPFTVISGTGTTLKRSFRKFAYHTVATTVSFRF